MPSLSRQAENLPPHLRNDGPLISGRGNSPFPKSLDRWFIFCCFWIIPTMWIWLCPPWTIPLYPITKTRKNINDIDNFIREYATAHNEVPETLAELRPTALRLGHWPNFYDSYGQRIHYLRLDRESYMVRSFGEDGIQNTIHSSTDIGLVKWGNMSKGGLAFNPVATFEPHLYPAAQLLGVDSPDFKWLARLFVDSKTHKRHLLIRHHIVSGLFMVAYHDAVEEFFWLDSSHIVFSASGSLQQIDGIYIWDIDHDQITNLLENLNNPEILSSANTKTWSIANPKTPKGLWITLAGISEDRKKIYAYVMPQESLGVSPMRLFATQNLYEFNWQTKPGGSTQNLISASAAKFSALHPPTSVPLNLKEGLTIKTPGALEIQEKWLKLPIFGNLESVITAWNQFAELHDTTPLFPYSLWILTALYSDSYMLIGARNPRDADVLRSFGVEISQVLLNTPTAPSYLRALAFDAHQDLIAGHPLPYRFFTHLAN